MPASRGRTGFVVSIARLIALAVALLATGAGPGHADDRVLFSPDELAAIARHAASPPLPADPTNRVADNPRAAAFGQTLFFDQRLSAGSEFSCASCHVRARALTDGRRVAEALARGTRNTPSLLNAAANHWFFWDGRADTLWAQPLQVIENPREFGSDRMHVAHVIAGDDALAEAYEGVFGKVPSLGDASRFPAHASPKAKPGSAERRAWLGMKETDRDTVNRLFANTGKALAAYLRRLVRHGSAFDRYAAALATGDPRGQARYPAAAKRGLKLFVGRGNCELCHSGPEFSDGEFHNIGLPTPKKGSPDIGRAGGLRDLAVDPFTAAGRYSDAPNGEAAKRLAYLPKPKDMAGAFKTPSLRNVSRTAPYMHDGRFATLDRVLRFYAEGKAASRGHYVGAREGTLDLIPHFTAGEIADLVAFLKTLDSAPLPDELTRPHRPD